MFFEIRSMEKGKDSLESANTCKTQKRRNVKLLDFSPEKPSEAEYKPLTNGSIAPVKTYKAVTGFRPQYPESCEVG